jgi:hypothetical protein
MKNPLKTKGKGWLALALVATALGLGVPPALTLTYHINMPMSILIGFLIGMAFGNIIWPSVMLWREAQHEY